jgi:membrane fusion protein, multidrug efflux system
VPETELPAVRLNLETHQLEVDAAIPNSPETPEHGVLSFIDNTVDKTTGTILLKGLFQNENRRLWPGEFVDVTLTLNQIRNAVLVPSQAIQAGQNGTFVFVVDNRMQAHLRPIVAGAQIGGETVVTDGQMLLVPGARVKIRSSL